MLQGRTGMAQPQPQRASDVSLQCDYMHTSASVEMFSVMRLVLFHKHTL